MLDDSKIRDLTTQGIGLIEFGKLDEAIQCFDEIIKINPDDSQAWYNKGATLELLEKYREAIECFDQVHRINPNHSRAWVLKGLSLKKLGKRDESKLCLDKADQLRQ